MNYLAHLALAKPSEQSLVGNLMGDFVSESLESLRDQYPAGVVEGVEMHRAIDRYTDTHPCFKEAKELLDTKRQRYAGVIVDILFDHYLAVHWSDYYAGTLRRFSQQCLLTLESHPEWMTPQLREALPQMRQQDWLCGYATLEGMRVTLERVSRRGTYTAPVQYGYRDLVERYQEFEEIFRVFYPQLQAYAKDWSPEV